MKALSWDDTTLGGRLRLYRHYFDVEPPTFKEVTGIDKTTLSKIENDHQYPSVETMLLLAKADIDLHWLITGVDRTTHGAPSE